MKKKLFAGITVTMFLVTLITFGIPARVSAFVSPDIVIGIVGPQGWIQWDGQWEGAVMAKDILNTAGGMKDAAGNGHEVKLVAIDEHAVPVPDPAAAVTEMLTALTDNPDMDTVIGGFRSECVFPIREAIMDFAAANDRPLYFIAGASTDELISDIEVDPVRYKYVFRNTPMNSTTLFKIILGYLLYTVQPKLSAIYGAPLKTKIVAEDLLWADGIVGALEYYLGVVYGALFNMTSTIRPSAVETDFSGTFATINAEKVKLVIHIFSAVAGAAFSNYYGATQQQVAIAGINVETMAFEFYDSVGGNCEYESALATIGSVQGRDYDINPNAKPLTTSQFWAQYDARWGHHPIYTAFGTYDSIIAMNETANQWLDAAGNPVPMSQRITITEQTVRGAMLGAFKYTGENGKSHDVYCAPTVASPYWPPAGVVPGMVGWPRAWIPQWYNGELEVVFPVTYGPTPTLPPLPFARKYRIPPRMYSLAESDWVTDGLVDAGDMAPIQTYYGSTPPWTQLSGDMDNNNYFDIDDATRIALDWGKNATQIYGQWPLP